ncbi:hypothetical protein AALB39_24590 [Lachnospiraceae bacterium 54-53]
MYDRKLHPAQHANVLQGWFFYACFQDFIEKCYLQLTKIKVSNAIMNIPKAIRSLKSYFIRTTSHLCMMEGQRPCSDTIIPCHYGNISHFNVQLLFPAAGLNGSAAFSLCLLLIYYKHSTQNCAQYLPDCVKSRCIPITFPTADQKQTDNFKVEHSTLTLQNWIV